jgi:CDP-2,3-bis-(O-geranylgeranyl)-sn-glycerol synthase
MRIWLVGHLVFLLVIANGTPVLLGLALGARWNWPLDNHLQFTDQRPVLGPSKTLRGLIGSLLVTALLAPLLQLSLLDGARFAMLAMLGDLCSSFTKRRFGLASGRSVPLLDQLPESILPLWGMQTVLGSSGTEMALAVIIFMVIDLLISTLLKSARA